MNFPIRIIKFVWRTYTKNPRHQPVGRLQISGGNPFFVFSQKTMICRADDTMSIIQNNTDHLFGMSLLSCLPSPVNAGRNQGFLFEIVRQNMERFPALFQISNADPSPLKSEDHGPARQTQLRRIVHHLEVDEPVQQVVADPALPRQQVQARRARHQRHDDRVHVLRDDLHRVRAALRHAARLVGQLRRNRRVAPPEPRLDPVRPAHP